MESLLSPKEVDKESNWLKAIQFDTFLGKGSFGVVLKATDKTDKTADATAVKIIFLVVDERSRAEEERRISREVNNLVDKRHPNIVTTLKWLTKSFSASDIVGMFESATLNEALDNVTMYIAKAKILNGLDAMCIQMELCGRTLRGWLNTPHPQNTELLHHQVAIIKGMVEGLKYLHSLKIIHRDVKPENIYFAQDCNGKFPLPIKIGDFGLSRELHDEMSSSLTSRVGTLHYMAPEVHTNHYTFKADLFSLGLVIWEVVQLIKPRDRKWMFDRLINDNDESLVRDHPIINNCREIVTRLTKRKEEERLRSIFDVIIDASGSPDLPLSVGDYMTAVLDATKINTISETLSQNDFVITNIAKLYKAFSIEEATATGINLEYTKGAIKRVDIIKLILKCWTRRPGMRVTVGDLMKILSDLRMDSTIQSLETMLQGGQQIEEIPASTSGTQPTTLTTLSMRQRNLELLDSLGGGAFGGVFKAQDTLSLNHCAVKRISVENYFHITKSKDEARKAIKLLREVKSMIRLNSFPNIVTYHQAWFEGPLEDDYEKLLRNPEHIQSMQLSSCSSTSPHLGTYLCIQMELCDTDLSKWMDDPLNPHLSWGLNVAEDIIAQILNGLRYMHDEPIAHRDLKPNNIFLNWGPHKFIVKIGDFGLCRDFLDTEDSLTKQVGCARYQSPEMMDGKIYNTKTDIFSTGLIYLILMHDLSDRPERIETFDKIRQGTITAVEKMEKAQGKEFTLLRKMLSTNSQDRPSAQEAYISICTK